MVSNHVITKALKLFTVEWLREEISQHAISGAVYEFDFTINYQLLQEPQTHFVVLGFSYMSGA